MKACILGCESAVLSAAERAFFRETNPFGFILFARNCQDREQLRRLVADLRAAVGRDAPVLIDEEGGRVQRMKPPCWRDSPAPGAFGEIFLRDPAAALELARMNARLIAEDLYEVGIDVNCAPLLDLREANGHAVIGDRAFAPEPETVVLLAEAWIKGLRAGGVVPVIKHLPGHGRTRVDSHHALPVVDADLADMDVRDFSPFRSLRDSLAGMTGHLLFSAIDPDHPATLSRKVVAEVIRQRIGFDGLLLTDDLSMSALCGSIGERAEQAIAAGCDIALHCNGVLEEMREVAAKVPALSGEGLRRAEAVLAEARAIRSTRQAVNRDQALDSFERKLASV
ncbi:MAG: beta-N-acetylhexosaminidase [Proteobacteria bacterium]|nr:beta-N-acetylhexosaminidase [Pseudomonadota bacterium]